MKKEKSVLLSVFGFIVIYLVTAVVIYTIEQSSGRGEISTLSYARLLVYMGFMSFVNHRRKEAGRAAIVLWRITAVLEILDILNALFFFCERSYLDNFLTFALFISCFLITPLFAQAATCRRCGRRVYWYPLVSGRCPHCKERL